MFKLEKENFYKAKKELKDKIVAYLNSLDEEIEICVNVDGEETVFVKIGDKVLENEAGFEFHYELFAVEELIEVLEEIEKYHQKGGKDENNKGN